MEVPQGKHAWMVKIGEKGQFVIPKEARDIFGFHPGDELLVSIIKQVDDLDSGIANVQDLAQRASTFISDTSYLLGGDFGETKQQLEDLVIVLADYDQKTTDWREQIATVVESAPRWIDNASFSLTLGLLWFGFSQFGLILHGLGMKRGLDPLDVLRTKSELFTK